MKIYILTSIAVLTLTLLAGCVQAQEIPAHAADGLVTPGIPWSPFTNKQRVDHLVSKPEDSAAGLIDAARYVFSVQSGVALEDMSSGTTQLIARQSDDINSALTPIGFLFRYDGAFFTHFVANTNGVIRLGGLMTGGSRINSIDSTENSPKITPYWDNLCTGNNGKVHYKKVGAGDGEKLVVEWKGMNTYFSTNCSDQNGPGTFQMWIFARTGVIQFVYGSGIFQAGNEGGYSVGIQSGAATNFASVTTAGNSVSYSTANNTQFDAIPAGTSYIFTPIMPLAPSGGSVTGITQSSAAISWADNAGDESAYLVRRTTDHVNFYFVGNVLAPNSTTFTDTGLTQDTQYFYYVNALSEGAFSPDLVIPVATSSLGGASSTAAGGPWSAPSTWAGGVVPGAQANVKIVSGATVIIDTDAAVAGDVTIDGGGVLKFGEDRAFKLTVGQNVTINPNGTFATGNGNANQHLLTLGGNLLNNGTLDFSTNNNMAGAGIEFTGASSNTFGGTGAVTDIFYLSINKGSSAANVLELNVANFTVQGSATDGPSSAYLVLLNGTFKISGSFAGAHRTFASAAYQIEASAGFWLNNPNYSVTPQAGAVFNYGNFRLSAGSYSVGTGVGHSFNARPDSFTRIEGGMMTIAGGFEGYGRINYQQSGGKLTTCTWGPAPGGVEGCFKTGFDSQVPASLVITGGEVNIQNAPEAPAAAFDNMRNPDNQNFSGGTVRFGNSQTAGAGRYVVVGSLPNLVIDTAAGGHTVVLTSNFINSTYVRNIDIGPGGILDTSSGNLRLILNGDTFTNNGTWNTGFSNEKSKFCNDSTRPFLYTGSGDHTGLLRADIACRTFTFGTAVGNLHFREVYIGRDIVNAYKLSLGNNIESGPHIIQLGSLATFDSAPTFELQNGTQELEYYGSRTIGLELNPQRTLSRLYTSSSTSVVKIEGGDLIVRDLELIGGRIDTGSYRLIHTGDYVQSANGGYVNGTLVRPFTQTGSYAFRCMFPGSSVSPVINLTSITTIPTEISVKTITIAPMPGLNPAKSLLWYWEIKKDGEASGTLRFGWFSDLVNGNVANYKIWRSTGWIPEAVPHVYIPGQGVITTANSESVMTGRWGVGESAQAPVGISGSVLTSAGAGIRNAVVTVSGGGLPAPVVFQTGQFGTYLFDGLMAGRTYTVSVSAKRFRFGQSSRSVTAQANVANLNFIANPQEEF